MMSSLRTQHNATQSSMPADSNQYYRRESRDEDGRPFKKPRASKPKVKSGCVTCKTRRVKCDEVRPQCLRCQKFGRRCDGYAPEPSQGRTLIQLQPRIPMGNIYGPSVSIHTTEAESQYFGIFVDRVAYELSGFFEPTFWTRLVLQESHNVPAIRHAAIAMGALSKSLENAPAPQLKVNVIQSIDRKHHEQAVFSHIKAIQALNSYISASKSPQLRTALIACLIFVCFETFQGSYASSVQQTYGGLKILRNYYAGTPGSRPWIPGQRALPGLKSTGRGKISQALLEREGCDEVFKGVAIVMHVEEYLNSETETRSKPQPLEQDSSPYAEQQDNLVQSAMYNPLVEHVKIPSMGGTDLNQEQQRNLAMYSPSQHKRVNSDEDSTSAAGTSLGSPWQAEFSSRENSNSSSSIVSTPATNTPPSTGPHTPSPSQLTHPTYTPLATYTSRKRSLASRSPVPQESPSLQNDLTIEEVLIQSFVRLDGQGLFFGMTPGIPPLTWDIHKVFNIPVPASFSSYTAAQRCWDFLMDRALQFYRRTAFNRAYAPESADTPAEISKQHAMHINALNAFSKTFQPFLDVAISPEGEILNPAALVLSLYPKAVAITLCTLTHDSEMLYDSFLEDFKYTVKTCKLLVAAEESIHLPRNTRFSFDIGIVPPLHITATKCRDPAVRREAIELLFKSPRQEGMWDGVLSARIGRWIMACEEEGLKLPDLGGAREGMRVAGVEQYTHARISSVYPSPPDVVDEKHHAGGWEDGKRICDIVGATTGHRVAKHRNSRGPFLSTVAWRPAVRLVEEMDRDVPESTAWVVPESSRFQLMVVDFHIPERYIKVKCRKVLVGKDGEREERETVIAW